MTSASVSFQNGTEAALRLRNVGPATVAVWLATVSLFGVALGLAVLVGVLLATLLSSPVLDELSRRVERIARRGGFGAGDHALDKFGMDGAFVQ